MKPQIDPEPPARPGLAYVVLSLENGISTHLAITPDYELVIRRIQGEDDKVISEIPLGMANRHTLETLKDKAAQLKDAFDLFPRLAYSKVA